MTDRLARLVRTRLSLHAVAELLLAGPQYERSKSIELRVTPGGFASTRAPDIRVDGADIVAGDRRLALDGRTVDQLAADLGLEPRDLHDVYSDGRDFEASMALTIDDDAAEEIARAFGIGNAALAKLSTDVRPILWPEHFDVGIALEKVNYGVSPGDDDNAEPYAYVGPWEAPSGERDPFWNKPFGAARAIAELGDEQSVLAFFAEGRDRT
ncbi:MAG TPA: hypothetical protein VH419_16455 [Nocardioidaceae bacterium]